MNYAAIQLLEILAALLALTLISALSRPAHRLLQEILAATLHPRLDHQSKSDGAQSI
jgi:hypothetical protein